MLNIQSIKSLSDLRTDPSQVTQLATDSKEPVYIFNRSKPVSVLLDVHVYQQLMEKLKDALDAVEMKKAEKKPKKTKDWISHKKLKQKLNLS